MRVTARNEAASRNNKRLTIYVLQDGFPEGSGRAVPCKDPLMMVFYKNIWSLSGIKPSVPPLCIPALILFLCQYFSKFTPPYLVKSPIIS